MINKLDLKKVCLQDIPLIDIRRRILLIRLKQHKEALFTSEKQVFGQFDNNSNLHRVLILL